MTFGMIGHALVIEEPVSVPTRGAAEGRGIAKVLGKTFDIPFQTCLNSVEHIEVTAQKGDTDTL